MTTPPRAPSPSHEQPDTNTSPDRYSRALLQLIRLAEQDERWNLHANGAVTRSLIVQILTEQFRAEHPNSSDDIDWVNNRLAELNTHKTRIDATPQDTQAHGHDDSSAALRKEYTPEARLQFARLLRTIARFIADEEHQITRRSTADQAHEHADNVNIARSVLLKILTADRARYHPGEQVAERFWAVRETRDDLIDEARGTTPHHLPRQQTQTTGDGHRDRPQ